MRISSLNYKPTSGIPKYNVYIKIFVINLTDVYSPGTYAFTEFCQDIIANLIKIKTQNVRVF